MRIVTALVENVLDLVDRVSRVEARIPDEEICGETQEQQLRRISDIQQAVEDIRRLERLMVRRTS